jgi:hypothetical protein
VNSGVSITIDTEWAPDEFICGTLSILNRYGISATLFSAHDDGIDVQRHERVLHPNFFNEKDDETVIGELHDIFVKATEIRSHGPYTNTVLAEVQIAGRGHRTGAEVVSSHRDRLGMDYSERIQALERRIAELKADSEET